MCDFLTEKMRVGPHVGRQWRPGASLEKQIAEVRRMATADYDLDLKGCQVFLAGPYNRKLLLGAEQERSLRDYIQREGLTVVAHGTYMDAPWSGNAHAAHFIKEELRSCFRAGISGLVIHLGVPNEDVVARVLPALKQEYLDVSDVGSVRSAAPRLYLENPHVKPANSNYHTPEQLNSLFRRVGGDGDVGICIDTAHLWSCGVDLREYGQAKEWLSRLEIPRVALMFHLNDSNKERGSGVDNHAPLMKGNMWGAYMHTPKLSGMWAFVEYAIEYDILTILERTSKADVKGEVGSDLDALRELWK